jgi:hypothetical protein
VTSIRNPESTDAVQPSASPADPVANPAAGTRVPFDSNPSSEPGSFQIWMHRLSMLLFVLISAVAGVLLLILPWTPNWTDNYLLLSYPDLRPIVSNGFFRGICSGLGLLDIWIGFWEAFHYQDRR